MPYIIVEGEFGVGDRLENQGLMENNRTTSGNTFSSRQALFNRSRKQSFRTAVSGLKGTIIFEIYKIQSIRRYITISSIEFVITFSIVFSE